MLVKSISFLIFAKGRNTMQIFPEKARELWNVCELRALVLTSLFLQIILILIGNWRKHSTSHKTRIILWLAYLSADSVATVSLGVLSNNQEDNSKSGHDSTDPNYVIMTFWAPFLLLHLGGPDNITAYSLEDNELWLRHLLGLVVQVGVAFYVFLRAWNSKMLNFLAIPMFVAGIIKFGERTWALKCASNENFRESMLPPPDPGPNYARYMEEYCVKKEEGFHVRSIIMEASEARGHRQITNSTNTSTEIVRKAHSFFRTFRRLCADLILSYHDITKSRSFFLQLTTSDEAFEVIELELGFMYDIFYTKAVLIHSWPGAVLRCISFSSTISVLFVFMFTDKEAYSGIDVTISYILLVGAIILEIYAVIIALSSDWTMLWLSKHKKIVAAADSFAFSSRPKRRWSNKLSQYNLIGISLKGNQPKFIVPQRIDKLIEKYRHINEKDDLTHLKDLIFKQLKEKSGGEGDDFRGWKELCRRRGDQVLERENLLEKFGWTIDLEFDQSILLWHVATDLCYYSSNPRSGTGEDQNREASKLLSDYMLYLIVFCPFMLPNGIGQIRFQDTCKEASEFFKERRPENDQKEACLRLREVNTEVPPSEVKGDRSKSVLFEACILAQHLDKLPDAKKRWELISSLWIEILSYAASQCRWSYHAQQLRRGGELLTHVWLLMAHLGITEQFQISKGHARAKLIVQ